MCVIACANHRVCDKVGRRFTKHRKKPPWQRNSTITAQARRYYLIRELSTLILFKSSVIYEKYSAKDESYSIVKHNVAFLSQERMQVTKTEQ